MCGHCRDMDQCLNVNGTCATGCGPGYRGDLCKTRKNAESIQKSMIWGGGAFIITLNKYLQYIIHIYEHAFLILSFYLSISSFLRFVVHILSN